MNADLSEYSGLADFIDKTLTKSNKNIKQAIAGRPEKEIDPNNNSVSFLELADEFQKCKNVNLIFQKLNKAFSAKIAKDCLKVSESLLEIQDAMKNLESYSLKFQEMRDIISFNDLKSLMSCLTKKIPTLSSLVSTCACRVKEIENAGDTIFEDFQQRYNSVAYKEMLPNQSGLDISEEAGSRALNFLSDKSKVLSKMENENKFMKVYYCKALSNIRKELSKILMSDKSFQRVNPRVNQSDSVHVNPTFGDNSGRNNAHSQNSFTEQDNVLEMEGDKDPLNSNHLNLHNYQPFNLRNEYSGIAGNNISGTTGGDDDPALKFNNILRKSAEKKEISPQSLMKLSQLQELISKYERISVQDILKRQKVGLNNKEVNFNKTFSQDSVSQIVTSFFGQSDLKGNLDFFKESSFILAKDADTGFPKELEVLKEIKEEIKEESLRRKQNKALNGKECQIQKEN